MFDHLNLQKLEEWAVRKALAKHGGNVSQAAEELASEHRPQRPEPYP